MTLLTLGASKINQGTYNERPKDEQALPVLGGCQPRRMKKENTVSLAVQRFSKADQFSILGTYGQWQERVPTG